MKQTGVSPIYKAIVWAFVSAFLVTLVWLETDVLLGKADANVYGPLFIGVLIGWGLCWTQERCR
jgi:hypothetical protein